MVVVALTRLVGILKQYENYSLSMKNGTLPRASFSLKVPKFCKGKYGYFMFNEICRCPRNLIILNQAGASQFLPLRKNRSISGEIMSVTSPW